MKRLNILKNMLSGIILAADVETLEELSELAKIAAQAPSVAAIKVGFILGLRFGLKTVVDTVREVSRLPLIYDHQKAGTDIPQMGKPFANCCATAGVDGVIIFPHAGPRTLEGFVRAAFECGLTPIVGLVMTHPAYLQSEGGYIANDAPDSICRTALELGVTNFILPGTKTDFVRQFAQGPLAEVKGVTTMMPGIGSQGGSIAAAFEAAAPHARFAIIGSAIYSAKDPMAALKKFSEETAI